VEKQKKCWQKKTWAGRGKRGAVNSSGQRARGRGYKKCKNTQRGQSGDAKGAVSLVEQM